jgi:hypothetical protein
MTLPVPASQNRQLWFPLRVGEQPRIIPELTPSISIEAVIVKHSRVGRQTKPLSNL